MCNEEIERRSITVDGRDIFCYSDGTIGFFYREQSKLHKSKGNITAHGYRSITLGNKCYFVHRLIATAFHPNPLGLPQVDHINRDREDNRPENLRWCDASVNCLNTSKAEDSLKKYGVHYSINPKEYQKVHNAEYKSSHLMLSAKQPNGKSTSYYFKSEDDELYKILKPLSTRERYYKYQEIKKSLGAA